MKLTGTQKLNLVLIVLLFVLFIFANFYVIRVAGLCAVEAYFYDKLLVAYQIGGERGMQLELEMILANDKMPHELATAREFKSNLGNIKEPDKFLEEAAKDGKEKIKLLRLLRNIAFVFILLFAVLRLVISRKAQKGRV